MSYSTVSGKQLTDDDVKKTTLFTMLIQKMTNDRPNMYKSILWIFMGLVIKRFTVEEWETLLNDLKDELIKMGWLPANFLDNSLTYISSKER